MRIHAFVLVFAIIMLHERSSMILLGDRNVLVACQVPLFHHSLALVGPVFRHFEMLGWEYLLRFSVVDGVLFIH
jgi:hypothetical protein